MTTDPLETPKPDPQPDPEPQPKRRQRIVCDFCGCELAADGGVLKTSERAKQLERADKEITDLQGKLETKSQEVEDLRAKLEKPPTPEPLKTNGGEKESKSFIRW